MKNSFFINGKSQNLKQIGIYSKVLFRNKPIQILGLTQTKETQEHE